MHRALICEIYVKGILVANERALWWKFLGWGEDALKRGGEYKQKGKLLYYFLAVKYLKQQLVISIW